MLSTSTSLSYFSADNALKKFATTSSSCGRFQNSSNVKSVSSCSRTRGPHGDGKFEQTSNESCRLTPHVNSSITVRREETAPSPFLLHKGRFKYSNIHELLVYLNYRCPMQRTVEAKRSTFKVFLVGIIVTPIWLILCVVCLAFVSPLPNQQSIKVQFSTILYI